MKGSHANSFTLTSILSLKGEEAFGTPSDKGEEGLRYILSDHQLELTDADHSR